MRIALIPQTLLCILCFAGSARAENNYDVLDTTGQKIFSIESDGLSYIGGGVYESSNSDGTVNFLNKDGKKITAVIPRDCKACNAYIEPSEPSAPVEKLLPSALVEISSVGLHGIIDGAGKIVLPLHYDKIRYLGPHTRLVTKFNRAKDSSETYIFNTQTQKFSATPVDPEMQFQPESEGLISFSKLVRKRLQNIWQSGYVNENNDVVISLAQPMPGSFSNGLALVRPAENRPGLIFINRKGENPCPQILGHSSFIDAFAVASTVELPLVLGIIDRNFKFVVPPSYCKIEPVAKNIFAAKEHEEDLFEIINAKGEKLFTMPGDVTEVGYPIKENQGLIIGKITHATAANDSSDTQTTIAFDINGKKIFEHPGWNGEQKDGRCVVTTYDHQNRFSGVSDINGKWLISPRDSDFALAEPDRLIERLHINAFDSLAFKRGHYDQFEKFLKDFDFIGMQRKEVENLLGEQDKTQSRDHYNMLHVMCGLSFKTLEIEYDHDKVKRWRFNTNEGKGAYIDTNMIFDPDSPAGQQKFIKKQSSL
ncbi:MAG: WG repeat-containing protein [Candidatus Obscuribacterales bacterium]|nr:WG repeat-containing protein [Candidatus Obscuribacterales bacterium]